jgi:hypothetical protein
VKRAGPSLKPLLWLAAAFVVLVVALAFWRASLPPPVQEKPLPLSFAETVPAAKVELKIDPRLKPYAILVDRLYKDGVRELKSFERQAAEDQARLTAKGLPVRPYQRSIGWTLTAESHDLISVKQSWFDDTGGAHPNSGAKGLLWDVIDRREVERSELLRPGADQARLDRVLCDAIKAAKAGRQGAVWDPGAWPCPKWADSELALAPSAQRNKLGGAMFLFDPYSIGPYVEGEWAITVPQAAFRGELAPAWTNDFAGAPAR